MKTRIRSRFLLTVAATILCAGTGLHAGAQSRADSLRKAYDFKGAVDWCERMMETTDSSRLGALEAELILAQNGLSMAQYCSQPEVVARYRFSLDDFFLFYPLENRSWRSIPNPLDSLAGRGPVRATYVPRDATEIYYSACDADGIRNLYHTALRDSVWSAPSLINEALTSAADEIYPYVTRDGKALFFASKGLFGMGGYDLYVSNWNEHARDWDPPVNLGFPYSSPYDDFLFVNSEDGQYSVFASNRACTRDSVDVFVLTFDSMPVHKEIRTVDGLKALCALTPQEDRSNPGKSAFQGIQEDENVLKYIAAMDKVRHIRDSIARFSASLEQLRDELKTCQDTERQAALSQEILSQEIALPGRQKQLKAALAELQQIEMEFLANGIVLDPDKLQAEADREAVGTPSNYIFTKNEPGPALRLNLEKPLPTFDYSFKILEVGQFAEDNTLPDGLLYQIQLFALSRKATEKELKGLSPVFERISASGKYVYSAGVFRSYADVLAQLNKVKNCGFKGAMIVAFEDGKSIPVPEARDKESQVRHLFNVRIWPENGQNLPEAALDAIHALTDKDITRTAEGTAVVFEVGPFSDRTDCALLISALKGCGVGNVSVVEANNGNSF